MAIAGTMRADMHTINSVVTATAAGSGARGRFVTARMGIAVESDVRVNTRSLPERV